MTETFAAALRALREMRGMSQAALAEAIGVARNTVQRWEAGGHVPDERSISAALEALDATKADRERVWRAAMLTRGVPPDAIGGHDDPTNGDEPAGCA